MSRALSRPLAAAMLCLAAWACVAPARAMPRRDPGFFDPDRFSQGIQLGGGYFWAQQWGRSGFDRGADIAIGGTSQTRWPRPWVLEGSASLAVRVFDAKSYSVSLPRHVLTGGIAFGPVEPFAGFGFSLMTIDYIHKHFGFGLLSPMATTGIGLKLGPLHITARGYVEYLWRWTAPDYVVRGVSVTLATVRLGPQRLRTYPSPGAEGPSWPTGPKPSGKGAAR